MAFRLRYGMLADYATQSEHGKRVIVGVFDRLIHVGEAAEITLPRCFLIASFSASALDGSEHEFEIRLVNESGQSVMDGPTILPVRFIASGPDYPLRAELAIELVGIKLPGLGDYEFQFWTKGAYVAGIELRVTPPSILPRSG